jgi:Fic family protein
MPKQVSKNELDAVVEALAGFPDGAGIDAIQHVLGGTIPRRTLQRRLSQLVSQERLILEGRARASRYRLPPVKGEVHITLPQLKAEGHGRSYIPISPEGEELRQMVDRPVQDRQPVGYNRDFLDSYQPNDTFYLTADIRQQLYDMGSSRAGQQPAGTYARLVFNRLLLDLSWNSSRLEGNTYSLLETQLLLEHGEAAEGKDALEAQMILNHKAAIELLVDHAVEIGLNSYTIRNLHALLAENLLGDPQACGRLRAKPVGIGGTVYNPLEVPQLIDECFQQILVTATDIEDPFEQAFFVMVHLPYLQPFEDVNKRVSRLAANIPLIRRNLCPLSFVDVPDRAYIDGILAVYELNRIELLRDVFVWAYQRSCARYSAVQQSLGDPDPFRLNYREQIKNFVAEVVRGCMDKRKAAEWIAQQAAGNIGAEDRSRFIEIIETELSSLNEGNIARYRLRPAEFKAWMKNW